MPDIWFTSDTHFGHANFLNFKDDAGEPVRPFKSVQEMDGLMIERWNEVVRDGDKVYHLGDVSFDRKNLPHVMAQLRGRKRLVLGNHDDLKTYKLAEYFQKVSMWRMFTEFGFVCSHVPLREDQMRAPINVHGHIHHRPSPSPRHICVCVEQTDYRPIHLDEIRMMISRLPESAHASGLSEIHLPG
jgi:calcineurin-like phosphoesterase family protein